MWLLIGIKKNCPGGCPCDSFDCEDDTATTTLTTTTESVAKKAVLVLSTYISSNVPMVIGYNGKQRQVFLIICNDKIKLYYSGVVDDDLHFKYGYNTEVYYSCAAIWNDE